MPGPVEHGGLSSEVNLPPGRDEVLDFSANLNPIGAPRGVIEAARRAVGSVEGYPEPYSRSLRRVWGDRLGVGEEGILFGCGSTEFIFLLARLFGGDRVLLGEPGFGEYRRALGGADAEIVRVGLDLDPQVEDYEEGLREGVDGCFVCSPHNPTGRSLEGLRGMVEEWSDVLFVVDRAFEVFDSSGGVDLRDLGNVVELHSLTKSFCIPGLRLGFMLGSQGLIEEVMGYKQPWTVGQVGTAAAAACLRTGDYLSVSRDLVERERSFLQEGLRDMGFSVVSSDANFFMVEVGEATRFKVEALREGVLVRDCSSFGFPDHVRVAVRGRGENEELLEAFSRVRGRL